MQKQWKSPSVPQKLEIFTVQNPRSEDFGLISQMLICLNQLIDWLNICRFEADLYFNLTSVRAYPGFTWTHFSVLTCSLLFILLAAKCLVNHHKTLHEECCNAWMASSIVEIVLNHWVTAAPVSLLTEHLHVCTLETRGSELHENKVRIINESDFDLKTLHRSAEAEQVEQSVNSVFRLSAFDLFYFPFLFPLPGATGWQLGFVLSLFISAQFHLSGLKVYSLCPAVLDQIMFLSVRNCFYE